MTKLNNMIKVILIGNHEMFDDIRDICDRHKIDYEVVHESPKGDVLNHKNVLKWQYVRLAKPGGYKSKSGEIKPPVIIEGEPYAPVDDILTAFSVKEFIKDIEENCDTHTIKARECPDCDKLKIPGIQCKNPLTGEFNCHPDLTFKPEYNE